MPDIVTEDNSTGNYEVYEQNTTTTDAFTTFSLDPFSLATRTSSLSALDYMKTVQQQIATDIRRVGAFVSRLEKGLAVLQVTRENYAAAESRIRDADIAHESSVLVRTQILQKAGASVLAQANLQPQLVLQLLGQ